MTMGAAIVATAIFSDSANYGVLIGVVGLFIGAVLNKLSMPQKGDNIWTLILLF